jgi:hypothetical protein
MIRYTDYLAEKLTEEIKSSPIVRGVDLHFDLLKLQLREAVRLPSNLNESFDESYDLILETIKEIDHAVNCEVIEECLNACKYEWHAYLLENVDFPSFLSGLHSGNPSIAGTAAEKLKTVLKSALQEFKKRVRSLIEPIIGSRMPSGDPADSSAPSSGAGAGHAPGPSPTGPTTLSGSGAGPVPPGGGPAPGSSTHASGPMPAGSGPAPTAAGGWGGYGMSSSPAGSRLGLWDRLRKRSYGAGAGWKNFGKTLAKPLVWAKDAFDKARSGAWLDEQAMEQLHDLFMESEANVLDAIDQMVDQLGKFIDDNVAVYAGELAKQQGVPATGGAATTMSGSPTDPAAAATAPKRNFPPFVPPTDAAGLEKFFSGRGPLNKKNLHDLLGHHKFQFDPNEDPMGLWNRSSSHFLGHDNFHRNSTAALPYRLGQQDIDELKTKSDNDLFMSTTNSPGKAKLLAQARLLGITDPRPKKNNSVAWLDMARKIKTEVEKRVAEGNWPPKAEESAPTQAGDHQDQSVPGTGPAANHTVASGDSADAAAAAIPQPTAPVGVHTSGRDAAPASGGNDIMSLLGGGPKATPEAPPADAAAATETPPSPEQQKAPEEPKVVKSPEDEQKQLDYIMGGLKDHGIDISSDEERKVLMHALKDMVANSGLPNDEENNGVLIDAFADMVKQARAESQAGQTGQAPAAEEPAGESSPLDDLMHHHMGTDKKSEAADYGAVKKKMATAVLPKVKSLVNYEAFVNKSYDGDEAAADADLGKLIFQSLGIDPKSDPNAAMDRLSSLDEKAYRDLAQLAHIESHSAPPSPEMDDEGSSKSATNVSSNDYAVSRVFNELEPLRLDNGMKTLQFLASRFEASQSSLKREIQKILKTNGGDIQGAAAVLAKQAKDFAVQDEAQKAADAQERRRAANAQMMAAKPAGEEGDGEASPGDMQRIADELLGKKPRKKKKKKKVAVGPEDERDEDERLSLANDKNPFSRRKRVDDEDNDDSYSESKKS